MSEECPINAHEHAINAHFFLKEFLNSFEGAESGGIHNFMEIAIFNMITLALKNLQNYLSVGHEKVNVTETLTIVADSFQKALDGIKHNLETMQEETFR